MANLEVKNIVKEFPTRDEPLRILNGVSLQLNAGENLAILGDSGSGKSTLLHIIGALDRPTSGEVTLNDVSPFSLSSSKLASFRNHNIGFVFQEHHLLPQLSVIENVLAPIIAEGRVGKDDQSRAQSLLKRVGLSHRSTHRPAELSGGERQRAAVARALIRNPQLLLADEPTGSLDHANAAAVSNLLLDLQKDQDTMLIVVTHSEELAAKLSRRMTFANGELK